MEDAMSALKGVAFSFRVVSSNLAQTAADIRLPSTDSILCLLRWVEKHMAERKPKVNNHRGSHSPQCSQTNNTSRQAAWCTSQTPSDDPMTQYHPKSVPCEE